MTSISSRRLLIVRLLLPLAGIAAVAAAGYYVRWLAGTDPFARYRIQGPGALEGDVGIRLEDVRIKTFRQRQAVSEMNVGRVDIAKNRSQYRLYSVNDGTYFGKEGAVHFSSQAGFYDSSRRRFDGSAGARVWNADMDLNVDALAYDESEGKLLVQNQIKGKLWDGIVDATRLEYLPESGNFETGPLSWVGNIDTSSQEEQQGQKVKWTIRSLGGAKSVGDIVTYKDFVATDGEVVVKAPTAVEDKKANTILASGGVKYWGIDANLNCDQVLINKKEKYAVLTGNVTMLVKPEEGAKLEEVEIPPYTPTVPEVISKNRPAPPESANEEQKKQDDEIRSSRNFRKYPAVVYAQKIDYWYGKGNRHAIVTGSPEAYQALPNGGWRRVWTPTALYDGEKKTLKMVSSPDTKDTRVQTSVGDDMYTEWFLVSTKKGEEDNWESGAATGEVMVNEDENRDRKNNQSKPPPDKKIPPLKGTIGGGPKTGGGKQTNKN